MLYAGLFCFEGVLESFSVGRVAAFFDRDGEDMMRGHRLCIPLGSCVIQAGAVLTSQLPKSLTADVYSIARALGSAPGESFLERGSAEGQCVHVQEVWVSGMLKDPQKRAKCALVLVMQGDCCLANLLQPRALPKGIIRNAFVNPDVVDNGETVIHNHTI